MAYSIACGDVMPGCAATFRADDLPTLLSQVASHAKNDHGLKEMTQVLTDKIQASVRKD